MAAYAQITTIPSEVPFSQNCSLLDEADTYGVSAEYRFDYLTRLRQWISQLNKLSERDLSRLINLAHHLCDWQTLIDLDKKFSIDQVSDKQLVAYAYWKSSYWEHAYHYLEQLMFKHPNHTEVFQLYDYLIGQAQAQVIPRYYEETISDVLSLEPLARHHCEEFLLQYWDKEIAHLCCLPELVSQQEWHDWFTGQLSFTDQTTQAIYHSEYGFVGVISLVMYEQTGFIYYWVGKDFQNHGIGSAAAKLMLKMATDIFGLNACYAKVFESNTASQKLLSKLGFVRASFNAAPPYQDEAIYYLGETKSEKDKAFELAELFEKMGSTTEVDMPLGWQLEFNYVSQR